MRVTVPNVPPLPADELHDFVAMLPERLYTDKLREALKAFRLAPDGNGQRVKQLLVERLNML